MTQCLRSAGSFYKPYRKEEKTRIRGAEPRKREEQENESPENRAKVPLRFTRNEI